MVRAYQRDPWYPVRAHGNVVMDIAALERQAENAIESLHEIHERGRHESRYGGLEAAAQAATGIGQIAALLIIARLIADANDK